MELPEFSDDYKPLVRDDLTVTKVEEELIVLNRKCGNVHRLNDTAAFIYQCSDGHTSVRKIRERLLDQFDVESQIASDDIRQLLTAMHNNDLLVA